ncbi:MAG: hypothetical protein A2176_15515 [Spirochaetes bacterium RBG_13_51_14]|nr:MAG: hypothetical protein A2176_15515 [Spirochaetes bacterium RBG_13_51_14]
MLQENYNITQKEDHIFRRWFEDDYFDLIVWHDVQSREIIGFQLCYNKLVNEHAFTWHREKRFSHNRIDDYPGVFRHPVTPILVPDGTFPYSELIKKFRRSCINIDEVIARLVVDKIIEYNNSQITMK